jgi:hypothetical protein
VDDTMTNIDIRFGFVMFTALNWACFGFNAMFGLYPHSALNLVLALGGMWALKKLPDYERTL